MEGFSTPLALFILFLLALSETELSASTPALNKHFHLDNNIHSKKKKKKKNGVHERTLARYKRSAVLTQSGLLKETPACCLNKHTYTSDCKHTQITGFGDKDNYSSPNAAVEQGRLGQR